MNLSFEQQTALNLSLKNNSNEQTVKIDELQIIDTICAQKLSSLQYWENIKRLGMARLLEEVLHVQNLNKKIKRLQKQQSKFQSNAISSHNDATDSEDELTDNEEEEEEARVLDSKLANEISIKNDKAEYENLYNLMKTFAKTSYTADVATDNKTKNSNENISQVGARKRRRDSQHSENNTTSSSSKRPQLADDDGISPHIVLGPNGTTISRAAWNTINWTLTGPAITRKILMEVFDRSTLAFHTLTGKPSPAFTEFIMPKKEQLNPDKVADILHFMTTHFDITPREVRSAITTKCADENKMHRQRLQKRQH